MNEDAVRILEHLQSVAGERQRQMAETGLALRVQAVKRFQHARFELTYADLRAQARYSGATRFFLDELYGPHDFTERDAQFARIVPALVRLFPAEIVHAVAALAELHALSEGFDTAMGAQLASADLSSAAYGRAWRAVGRPEGRERQIVLMMEVGQALDRLTRKPLLRQTLRLMRGPATSAGLGALQRFLESGFDTFREMRGSLAFLETIAQRERALSMRLFQDSAL